MVYLTIAFVDFWYWNIYNRIELIVQHILNDDSEHLGAIYDAQLYLVCKVIVPVNVVIAYKYLSNGYGDLDFPIICEVGQDRMVTLNG